MSKQSTGLDFDKHINDRLIVTSGMKLSVVWRQLDSAVSSLSTEIAKYNGALSKTLPLLKKKEFERDLQGTREGKYIKFPDGSQARY